MSLAPGRIDGCRASSGRDAAPGLDLRNALRTKVDRHRFAVFFGADMQPGLRVLLDAIRKCSDGLLVRDASLERLVILEDAPAVPDHAGHRAARREEVAIAEGIARNHTVRRD